MAFSMQLKYNNPKVVNAWCMYDWANSVYNLVITTTFFPIFFLGVTKAAFGEDNVPFMGRVFKNSALYDYALAFAYLAIAIILPILSSIADSQGNKKKFMQFFCLLGGFACSGLFWFRGENIEWGITCFILAVVGYVGSLVFYNSYLPEIAAPEDRDRISARGYAMGYIGSVILQIIGFGLVIYFSSQNDKLSGPLYTFLLVGIWWIGFAQITFAYLPSNKPVPEKLSRNFLTRGFIELGKVWNQIKKLSVLKWYLTAFFFYSMGVQTVMLAAIIFASKILGLPSEKLIITAVLIQLLAVAGAILMSRLSERFGNLKVLMAVVLMWIFICFSAYEVTSLKEAGHSVEVYFYFLAMGVGLIMGGIQSLSRSTYSKLMPVTKDTASFFSFYDVAEKVAIVIGIFTFGYIDELLGMKNSLLSLIVFFVLGFGGLMITYRKQLLAKS
ncbi:MAG: MFS transporter [Cyclobacteriaceae bacterium]